MSKRIQMVVAGLLFCAVTGPATWSFFASTSPAVSAKAVGAIVAVQPLAQEHELPQIFEYPTVSLEVRATVAFANGSVPEYVVLVVETTRPDVPGHSRKIEGLTSADFVEIIDVPEVFLDGRVRVSIWWHADQTKVPAYEDELFDRTEAPYRAKRTIVPRSGVADLGGMTLSQPPYVGRVEIVTQEPLRVRIGADEASAVLPTPDFDALKSSGFDLLTWSTEPEWWILVQTEGGVDVLSEPLTRDGTATVVCGSLGAVSGTAAPVSGASGWSVMAVPKVDGAHITFPGGAIQPSVVASALMWAPSAPVVNDTYALVALLPGEYTMALISPGYVLHAQQVIIVAAGNTTVHNF